MQGRLIISNFRAEPLEISVEPIAHGYSIPAGATVQLVVPDTQNQAAMEIFFAADGGVGIVLPEETEVFIEGRKLQPA